MHPRELPILERADTVPFFWPINNQPPKEEKVEAYSAEISYDRATFEAVQDSIGWHVTEDHWLLLSNEIVENSMVIITHRQEPVAVSCGLSRDDNWVELAWVAVAPAHRGLARIIHE